MFGIIIISMAFLMTVVVVSLLCDFGQEPTDNVKYDIWSD